jgi:hypothetical protein
LFQGKNLLEAILLIHYRSFEVTRGHSSVSAVHEDQEEGRRISNEISQITDARSSLAVVNGERDIDD